MRYIMLTAVCIAIVVFVGCDMNSDDSCPSPNNDSNLIGTWETVLSDDEFDRVVLRLIFDRTTFMANFIDNGSETIGLQCDYSARNGTIRACNCADPEADGGTLGYMFSGGILMINDSGVERTYTRILVSSQ